MVTKVAISKAELINSFYSYFKVKDVEIYLIDEVDIIDLAEKFDLVVLHDFPKSVLNELKFKAHVINVHSSLLPAFDCDNPIEQAFEYGVKVSGITVVDVNLDKILAQYPILIGLDTHIEEFCKEVICVEQKLLPPVVDAVVSDRVFDYVDLFQSSCNNHNGCSGCGDCH